MGANTPDVTTFLVLLLIVVTLVAIAVRWIRLPYEVALVLVGLVLALLPGAPHVTLTRDVILTVFLPVLLFHGAYNLSLTELRASIRLVAFLAVPGVLATAGLVGVALHLAAGLSWSTAFLFGTIVAATDPVSVLAIFGQVGAPRRLTTIVSGESLFNDGTALVLFVIVLKVATNDNFTLLSSVTRLVLVITGSLILGAAAGLVVAQVLRRVDEALIETMITLILAYGGYLLADHLSLSGPLETVVAGLMLSTRGEHSMNPTTRLQAEATWEFLDFLANSLLFLLMGLAVRAAAIAPGERLGWQLAGSLLAALLVVEAARLVIVLVTSRVMALAGQPLARGWDLILVWAGLRGAVSLAAALSLPATLVDHDLLLALTFGVVIFTLLAQGLTITPLLKSLGLYVETPSGSVEFDLPASDPPAFDASAHEATDTLDPVLTLVAQDQGLDEEHLAGWLGISIETLASLRRVARPNPLQETYGATIGDLAKTFGCIPRALEGMLYGWWATGLVWALRDYQRRYTLSDEDLATYLQIPESRLGQLYRFPRPDPDDMHFVEDIARIAESVGCSKERLAAVVGEASRSSIARESAVDAST